MSFPNQEAKTQTTAWKKIHRRVAKNGGNFSHFILDNELSDELKTAFENMEQRSHVSHHIFIEVTQQNMILACSKSFLDRFGNLS